MTTNSDMSPFHCDFKIVNTEIKHKLIIPIKNNITSVSHILDSIKYDIPNKFKLHSDVDIIRADQGESGNRIEYSEESAQNVFRPSDVFYIRPIEDMEICSESEDEHQEQQHHQHCECPVCYATISERNVQYARFFRCQHVMCHNCHNHLINRICPLCRAAPRDETGTVTDAIANNDNRINNINEHLADNNIINTNNNNNNNNTNNNNNNTNNNNNMNDNRYNNN